MATTVSAARSNPAAPAPLVVVGLHGYGIDERQLATLVPLSDLAHPVLRVNPRAPLAAPEGGYAWFPVRQGADGPHIDAAEVEAAVDLVVEHVRVARSTYPASPVTLLGYSQGAAVAVASVPRLLGLADAVVAIAGSVPNLPPPRAGSARGLPVLLGFGTLDPVIGEPERRATRAWLAEAGAAVSQQLEAAPHVVTAAHRRRVARLLGELAAGPGNRPGA